MSFLRDEQESLAEHVNLSLSEGVRTGAVHVAGSSARWYWRRLSWDTSYFGMPVIRLENASWDTAISEPVDALARAIHSLRAELDEAHEMYYVFAELPAQDLAPIQALGLTGFRLIETRLTYFAPDVAAIAWPERSPVRHATAADVPHLRDVATQARNPFDRYHADPAFGDEVADRYLGTYAAELAGGMATVVVLPDPDDGMPPGALFAATITLPPLCPLGVDHDCPLPIGTGRIVLVAVSQARQGWHLKLLAETTRLFGERSVGIAYMTTQATNNAVIRNCERVGYRYGRAAHVLALSVGRRR